MIRSIEARVALFVAAGTLAAIVVFAWVLGAFAESYARRGLEARVEVLAGELSASLAVAADGTLEIIRPLEEPAFERARSGWYWVARRGGGVIGQSRSLVGQSADGLRAGTAESPFGEALVARARPISATPDATVLVAGPVRGIADEVSAIRRLVAVISALLGAVLICGTTFLISQALKPLRGLTRGIDELRQGKAEAVAATGIANLDAVAEATNRLSASLRRMAERGLQDAENLAHAIKTPLSLIVLRAGPAGASPDADISAAAERIARQIDSRLRRVRAAASAGVLHPATALADTVADAVLVASRAHGQGRVSASLSGIEGAKVSASREQLDEMVGALVDNAFRHARSRVEIGAESRSGRLVLTIADDGPGIPADRLALLPERGRRLDERPDGDGLGLAIAEDIVADLGGTLSLANRAAPATGLIVTLDLPAGLNRT